jgi:Ca2+-binding RTX toxin-like protein
MTTTNVTSSQAYAGLIESSTAKWTGTITYSIPGSSAVWQSGYQDGEPLDSDYGIFNATQAANFDAVMDLWESYIAPAINKVSDSTPGDIRIAFTDVTARAGSGVAAYAYTPPSGGEIPVNGDVWVDETYKSSSFSVGSADFEILLHEVGHALGLKHSFETPTLPAGYDSTTYTVMSYTTEDMFFTWSGGGGSISYSAQGTTSFTPMVLDILAIQNHYGADTSTATGNTTYVFTDSKLNGRQAIHDAGGTDTLDLSALSRGSNLDLRPGAYSDLAFYDLDDQIDDLAEEYGSGFEAFIRQEMTRGSTPAYEWERNLGIAFSTTIENAIGSSKVDKIVGNSAANRIDGRGGADRMEGLTGNDTYIVDNGSDTIIETSSQGSKDTVLAKVTFDLLSGVHVEKLAASSETSTTALNLYGNSLKQEIIGNAGKNIISDGGTGAADTLKGLGGNDTYRVFNSGDVIVETSSQGASDVVEAGVNYTLGAGVHVEILRLRDSGSTTALQLSGNELFQTIIGNAGANILRGFGDNDALMGQGGADQLFGGTGNDTMIGGDGDDKLFGGTGNDTLVGNTGADDYIFDTALNGTSNVDKIVSFSSIDEILLSKAIFTAIGAVGTLASAAFASNTSGNAGDTSDRIIYEIDTGELYYDANGSTSGGSVLFATLDKNLSLGSSDFIIVA